MATYNISDLNKRELTVTPDSIVVVPGGTSTLRIRSNCAWCVTSRPELAIISRICGFGDGSLTISSPEDTSIDGEITFTTDDESVTQKVVISSTEPEPAPESAETDQNDTTTSESAESSSGEQTV